MSIEDQIEKLQDSYNSAEARDKDKKYEELLDQYKTAVQRIDELESQLAEKTHKLPTKDEVDTMASMLDLINKLDDSTIEKLSKFGDKR